MTINRVLCPVDFSDTSRKALRHAAAVATWYDAALHVVHVIVDPSGSAVAAVSALPTGAAADIQHRADAALKEFIEAADLCTRPAHRAVRAGNAVAEILEYARDTTPDLIVLGTHGWTGLQHALLGSTAERVVQHATIPVLTIPRDAHAVQSPALVQFKRILCACDFSPSSMRSLEYAISLAQENSAGLTLLRVIETLSEEEALAAADQRVIEYVEARKQQAQMHLSELAVREICESCDTNERVEIGAPAHTILRVASEIGADLIVMGSQGRGALALTLFGSTTQTVLRRATCPVLTARAVK